MRDARPVFARGALLLLACVASVLSAVDDDAEILIGVDFGSEWIEVAVAQGTSIDIVLNENTQRKSLAALAFPDTSSKSDNELRTFGEAAMARPHLALQYIRELLGGCKFLLLSLFLVPCSALSQGTTKLPWSKSSRAQAGCELYFDAMILLVTTRRSTSSAEQYVRTARFSRHNPSGSCSRDMQIRAFGSGGIQC
jgi:hypothetical protein